LVVPIIRGSGNPKVRVRVRIRVRVRTLGLSDPRINGPSDCRPIIRLGIGLLKTSMLPVINEKIEYAYKRLVTLQYSMKRFITALTLSLLSAF